MLYGSPRPILPVDVSGIENLTIHTGYLGMVSNILYIDRSLAQVGAHRKIGNRCDQRDSGCNVMEDTIFTGFGEGMTYEGQ